MLIKNGRYNTIFQNPEHSDPVMSREAETHGNKKG